MKAGKTDVKKIRMLENQTIQNKKADKLLAVELMVKTKANAAILGLRINGLGINKAESKLKA